MGQGVSEGKVSIALAPLAFHAPSEVGGAGIPISRQNRAGRGGYRRCRRKFRSSTPANWRAFRRKSMRSSRPTRWPICSGKTSASNVSIHEIALSDQTGNAELFIPQTDQRWSTVWRRSNPRSARPATNVVSVNVPTARLDAIVHQNVAFVKIDVEGHELSVLKGAVGLLEQSQPVFLVEAEDRHRSEATRSIFEFFENRAYKGFFLKEGRAVPVDQFRSEDLQDASALLPNGGRKSGAVLRQQLLLLSAASGRGIDPEQLMGARLRHVKINSTNPWSTSDRIINAYCHGRRRLCRAGVRGVLFGFWTSCRLRRQR